MSFQEFSNRCELISNTNSKNAKIKLLADYLRALDDQSLEIACNFLSNRIFPYNSGLELNIGYSNMIDLILEISNISKKDIERYYITYGDLGLVIANVIKDLKVKPLFKEDLDLRYLYSSFKKIAEVKGIDALRYKKKMLEGLLINASELEAKYLVKIILKELRIGAVEGLLEYAISHAFEQDITNVRRAILFHADPAAVALAAKHNKLDTIRMSVLTPVSFMLADTIDTIDTIDKEFIIEYKYDGIRAQLHKSNDIVKIFSRRLEDITVSFTEIVEEALSYKHEFILDGEIVAFSDIPLPFNELQKRLRSSKSNVPIKYFVYDILYLDNSICIDKTLKERKELLEGLEFKEYILKAPYIIGTKEDIIKIFEESKRWYEGLMLKEADSLYQVGKRGKQWLKLKRIPYTLDLVIVGAEYGHGKRANLLSNYIFAIRDGKDLNVIGKAYSGLSNEEIRDMTDRLKRLMIADKGYSIIVKPEIVVEVAFERINKSNRHESNFALRFPRIKRVRYDKSVDDIDTIERVRLLYEKNNVI